MRRAALRAGGIALFAGALHVALGAYSCSDPIDGSKGPGEPCTRTEECQWALACTGGICREHDAGTAHDAAVDAGGSSDAGGPSDAALDGGGLEDAAVDDAGLADGG